MRRILLALLLLATPAAADMYQDGSNAKLPEAVNNLAKVPGAVGDGTADDTAAVAAYLTAMAGRTIHLDGKKKYRLTGPVTIPSNTTLDCQASPGTVVSGSGGYAIGSLGGLRLDTAATVTVSAGARLQHCSVLHSATTWPQADASAYAGTAIKFAAGDAADAWLDDLLIVGFAQCVDIDSDRMHLINVEADCTNAFKIGASADTSYLQNLRAWPWGTFGCAASGCTRRSGTAFLFNGKKDHTVAGDLLAFGYAIGIDMEGADCCSMSFDGTYWSDTNTTALKIGNTVASGGGVDFYFASIQDVGGGQPGPGIVFNNTNSRVRIGRLAQWKDAATTDCVQNNGAQLHIGYAHITGCGVSAVNTTAGQTTVVSGSIHGIAATPYFKVPGTGTPTNVNVGIGPAVIADVPANLLPAGVGTYVYQNSERQHIGLGTNTPDRNLVVSGAGAAIGVYNTTGNNLVLGAPAAASGDAATIEVQGNNSARVVANGVEVFKVTPAGMMIPRAANFSTLTACSAAWTGSMASVLDSTTNVWGGTITGGGGNHVIGYCNGAAWTVMAK